MTPKTGGPIGPVLYRCSLGGEMKPIGAYSDNQKKKVGFGIRKIDPGHSKMVCREHAPTGATSYKCEGYCHRILPLSMFSKNTRRDGEYVCVTCREWLDSEPDSAKAAEKIRAALEEEADEWDKRAEAAKIAKKPGFRGTKTADFSDSGTVADSMYGFLDHLLVDDEDEAISITNLSVGHSQTNDSTTASAMVSSPLVALSSAASNAFQVHTNKPRQPQDEMSSIASNSWYGGGPRRETSKDIVSMPTGNTTSRSTVVSADTTARIPPHLLTKEALTTLENTGKRSIKTESSKEFNTTLPPHLRANSASGKTAQLAPHERGLFLGETDANDFDTSSNKSVSTIKAKGESTPVEVYRDTTNRDTVTIVPEVYRATRLVHRDQQQWLKAQPEGAVDVDSDEDFN
ncbi:hypothetical protein F5X68DRAFT_275426 [Plectosphaerella plurivora]|uniref:Stc1 domain-containing protein n=1 Tax=Plectosphaerella plurivora TaxID=936078 RepID=A0A9P9ACT6_9PEZI|nr:hypothetical protein F5X68DRAFT_275426 [Plectosphaerella plurivora]